MSSSQACLLTASASCIISYAINRCSSSRGSTALIISTLAASVLCLIADRTERNGILLTGTIALTSALVGAYTADTSEEKPPYLVLAGMVAILYCLVDEAIPTLARIAPDAI